MLCIYSYFGLVLLYCCTVLKSSLKSFLVNFCVFSFCSFFTATPAGLKISLCSAVCGGGRSQRYPQFSCHFQNGEPYEILHRLDEFFKLFLSDGLNSEYFYLFGLKD